MKIFACDLPSKVKSLKMLSEAGWNIPPTLVIENPRQFNSISVEDLELFRRAVYLYIRFMWDTTDGKSHQNACVCQFDQMEINSFSLMRNVQVYGVIVVQPVMNGAYGGCVLYTSNVCICEMVEGLAGALVRKGSLSARVVDSSQWGWTLSTFQQANAICFNRGQFESFKVNGISPDNASCLANATFTAARQCENYLVEWLSFDSGNIFGLDARKVDPTWFLQVKTALSEHLKLGVQPVDSTYSSIALAEYPDLQPHFRGEFSDLTIFAEGAWLAHASIYRMLGGKACVFSRKVWTIISDLIDDRNICS